MSLPHATQDQIKKMNEVAEEKMRKDGIATQSLEVAPIENKHPMLQHHQEPEEHIDIPVQDNPVEEVQEPKKTLDSASRQKLNFKMMRDRLDKAERERDEAMKYAMSMNQTKPQQKTYEQPEQEEDYLSGLGIDADSLAEGKHLKAVLKEVKDLKKELNHYKARTTEDTTRIKLQSNFPDYDQVMTQSNLNALESSNPDLAELISNTPDLYKRAKLAYDMVKRYGIYKDKTYDHDKVVAQRNAAKPKPLASVSPQQGDSPLSKANAFANMPLSKDVKDQLHREMIAAMKGR